jgi:probable O-glycosylation ligase (exosortase A-associated)
VGLYFTLGLTYGGAALAIVDPFIGLLVYVCFAILRPDDLWFWVVPHGNYSRIVGIAMLVGWILRGFGNWNFGKARIIVVSILACWAWAVLSFLWAPDFDVAGDYVERFTKIVLPFIVGVTIINSVERAKVLAWLILLCHGYLAYEMNLRYLAGDNVVREQGFSYMDNNGVAVAMDVAIGFAFFLGMATKRWWLKLLALGSAVAMVHVVLFSFSRGGMLGLAVTGLMAFILIPKTWKHYLVLIVVVLLGFRLAGSEVRDRFMTAFEDPETRDESAQTRLGLWSACFSQMGKEPLLGCGPGHWQFVVEDYGFEKGKAAHSTWFEVSAELGVPAGICLISFFVFTLLRLWPCARGRMGQADPWYQDSARMVFAAVIGFMVSASFITIPLLESVYYVILIGVSSLKLASQPSRAPVSLKQHALAPG